MQPINIILDTELPIRNVNKRYINHGGCGLYALRLSRALRAVGEKCAVHLVHDRGGFQYHMRELEEFIDGFSGAFGTLNDAIINHSHAKKGGSTFAISHICVLYKGVLYDSEGVCDTNIAHPTAITDEALLACVQNGHVWNPAFRRAGGSRIGKHIILEINHAFGIECTHREVAIC
jgi:hypothetical protein